MVGKQKMRILLSEYLLDGYLHKTFYFPKLEANEINICMENIEIQI